MMVMMMMMMMMVMVMTMTMIYNPTVIPPCRQIVCLFFFLIHLFISERQFQASMYKFTH